MIRQRACTRAKLIDAVHTAIDLADLTDSAKEALREVARSADKVAVGEFVRDGVGCPATQAGLWVSSVHRQDLDGCLGFACAFDNQFPGEDAYVMEIF